MKWKYHDEWATRLGISEEVSRYVNRIVDNPPNHDLPDDYKNSVSSDVIELLHNEDMSSSKRTVMERITTREVRGHDSARKPRSVRKVAADIQLSFLQEKGEEYTTAWFLHHQLDYIFDRWDKDSSVVELVFEHSRERPLTFSDDVGRFLIERRDILRDEMDEGIN